MAVRAGSVELWVNPLPLDFGICQIPLPVEISWQSLQELAATAKSKAKSGWPNMSYRLWHRFATSKLHLTEEQVLMYFEAFLLLLSDDHTRAKRIQWYSEYASASSKSDRDALLQARSVPTQQFMLFLYIQQSTKVSLKTKLMAGDEWKQSFSGYDSSSPLSGNLRQSNVEEGAHLRFVCDHIQEIVQLLVEPNSYSSALADQEINNAGIEALEFLLCSQIDGTVKRLRELVMIWSESPRCGYSKIKQTFSLVKLCDWLQSHLGLNPHGVSAVVASGKCMERLASQTEGSGGKGRLISNRTATPKEFHVVVFAGVSKLTVVKGEDDLMGAAIRIHRCRCAYLYLLSPLRHARIDACQQTTILLGAVEGVVYVTKCVRCTIIALCGNVHISDCNECTFHVSSLARPILLARNERLVLAPYHTHYPTLAQHIEKAGLVTTQDCWRKPIESSESEEFSSEDEIAPAYLLMLPSDFCPFITPVTMDGPLKENPCPLPKAYREALAKRRQSYKSWQKMIKEVGLNADQKQKLQTYVEGQFEEWLRKTGNEMQLLTS
eukprot:m.80637 g.80637  ORF g.80637 m.80637 type:complete len:551 (+) comp36204_c0_seq22:20-1672(+)